MLKRLIANVLVVGILASSAYAIFVVVERSLNFEKRMRAGEQVSWVEQNEVMYNVDIISQVIVIIVY